MFPLKDYKYDLPKPYIDAGGFGTKRKYDNHTGVDLYCEDKTQVYAIEEGQVIDICQFTGFEESPWWEDTFAVIIKSKSGYILYGEIMPIVELYQNIKEDELIGTVKRILKKDKEITPTSMLHLELYSEYTKPVWWIDEKPENLRNITELLYKQLIK